MSFDFSRLRTLKASSLEEQASYLRRAGDALRPYVSALREELTYGGQATVLRVVVEADDAKLSLAAALVVVYGDIGTVPDPGRRRALVTNFELLCERLDVTFEDVKRLASHSLSIDSIVATAANKRL